MHLSQLRPALPVSCISNMERESLPMNVLLITEQTVKVLLQDFKTSRAQLLVQA